MRGLISVFIICCWYGVAFAYDPPLGIPDPATSFGMEIDADAPDTSTECPSWPSSTSTGCYYVDSSTGDDANGNGCPNSPRLTIPTPSAGEYIELHGAFATLDLSSVTGTEADPIWIIGDGTSNTFGGVDGGAALTFRDSSYIYFDSVIIDGTSRSTSSANNAINIFENCDHIIYRNGAIRNFPAPDYSEALQRAAWWLAVINITGSNLWASGEQESQIVFYNNDIHDSGTFPPTYEEGRHQISIAGGSYEVWVVGNRIYNSGEDGVQVYWEQSGSHGPRAERVYVGGNTIYNCGENAVDVKQSLDVIVSENELYGFEAHTFPNGSGSDGSAIVLNDDSPSDYLWAINNVIYNCNVGIRTQCAGNSYIIGNTIYDITQATGALEPTSPGRFSGAGVAIYGATYPYVVNNTITRTASGIYAASAGDTLIIQNNLIYDLSSLDGYPIAWYTANYTATSTNNSYYDPDRTLTMYGTCPCTNCITGDPLLTATYTVPSGSPIVDQGAAVDVYSTFSARYGRTISTDRWATNRPQGSAWDIGAYEYRQNVTMRSKPLLP